MMCKKGTTDGKGMVCMMGPSSVERQFQEWKGTFPDKRTVFALEIFLKGKHECGEVIENNYHRQFWIWSHLCSVSAQLWSCCWPLHVYRAPDIQDFCLFSFSFLGWMIIICPLRENTVSTETTAALRNTMGQLLPCKSCAFPPLSKLLNLQRFSEWTLQRAVKIDLFWNISTCHYN